MSAWALDIEESLREEHNIPDDEEVDIWDPRWEGEVRTLSSSPWQSFRNELDLAVGSRDGRNPSFDVFVSFASHCRSDFVTPLVEELKGKGLTVWFDQEQVGRYAYRSINDGLASATVGLVVISEEYFQREWTIHEFEGLLASAIRGLVVVSYRLPPSAEAVLRSQVTQAGKRSRVRFIRLRSNRVRALANTTAGLVRSCSGFGQLAGPGAEALVARLRDVLAAEEPDLTTNYRVVEERTAHDRRASIRIDLEKYDSDELEDILRKFPELKEAWNGEDAD